MSKLFEFSAHQNTPAKIFIATRRSKPSFPAVPCKPDSNLNFTIFFNLMPTKHFTQRFLQCYTEIKTKFPCWDHYQHLCTRPLALPFEPDSNLNVTIFSCPNYLNLVPMKHTRKSFPQSYRYQRGEFPSCSEPAFLQYPRF